VRHLVLDNEAVQALASVSHPKHKRVLTYLDGQSLSSRHQKLRASRWVPATVRVEAGWDRTDPSAASVNRLKVLDRPLTPDRANAAARLVALHGVSPADAHLGATVQALSDQPVVVVLTSDPDDIAQVCPPGVARIIRI
jgi:hypothetical protein